MTTLISLLMGIALQVTSVPLTPAQTAQQMQAQQACYAMQCYLMYQASKTPIHIGP